MAGCALQIDAQKGLGHALSKLNLHGLTGTDFAAPADSVNVSLAGCCGWCNQLAGKLVERFVLQESIIEPATDLLATSGNESGPAVVVAEQVIEEGQPVICIGDAVIQQGANEA